MPFAERKGSCRCLGSGLLVSEYILLSNIFHREEEFPAPYVAMETVNKLVMAVEHLHARVEQAPTHPQFSQNSQY